MVRFAVALGFGPLADASGILASRGPEFLATPSGIPSTALLASPLVDASGMPSTALLATPRPWKIRLCNAFAYDEAVDVFHIQSGRRSGMTYTNKDASKHEHMLTEDTGPLAYKRCADVDGVKLVKGSILEFRITREMQIGTFMVNNLPVDGSMLQLAIKRRDTWSTAADFSSHVFTDASIPQVAIVDAYLGHARSALEVRTREEFDPKPHKLVKKDKPQRHQDVHFDRVVEIPAGEYDWILTDSQHHAEKVHIEFKAAGRKLYTVLRVGAEAMGGQSFPEELVIWPMEGAVIQHGGVDLDENKGLFGLPNDIGKFRRSAAAPYAMSTLSVALLAMYTVLAAGI